MKKKVLATLLASCIVFSVCACGGNSGSTSIAAPASDSADIEPATYEEPATVSYFYEEEMEEDVDLFNEADSVNDFSDQEEFIAEDAHSEIIMVRSQLTNVYNYTIYGVDSETGAQRVISEFSIPVSVIANADGSEWTDYPMFIPTWSNRMPMRSMFSKDYNYIATTRYSSETGEYRAGYYDNSTDLIYYDVSFGTGSVGGDFDEPVRQMAIGFDENDNIIYADMPSAPGFYINTSDWTFSEVYIWDSDMENSAHSYEDVDNLLLRGEQWDWLEDNCAVTDWINDTQCLINYPEESVGLMMGGDRIDRWGCRILDIETQTTTSFIPGEARSNWSGVISPDGLSVAFLSAPVNGTGNASLYITSLEGGEPVKITDDIPSERGSTGYTITRPESGKVVYFLLEWKE